MTSSHAAITSEVLGPARLMNRLAKHWSHRFDVQLQEDRALIPFPAGTCALEVDGTQLHARIEAEDAAALELLEGVVADHLARMAREPVEVRWQR